LGSGGTYLDFLWLFESLEGNITNNSGFRQKQPGVPDGSDGSDGTSYPLMENYPLPVAQATGPSLLD
jgi:hypothetical protein